MTVEKEKSKGKISEKLSGKRGIAEGGKLKKTQK